MSTALSAALNYVRAREHKGRLEGTTLSSSTAEAIARLDSSSEGYSSSRRGRLQVIQSLREQLFGVGGVFEDVP